MSDVIHTKKRGFRAAVSGLLAGAFALTSTALAVAPASAAGPVPTARPAMAAGAEMGTGVIKVDDRDWRRRIDRSPRYSRDNDHRRGWDRDRRSWRDRDRRWYRDRDNDNDLAAGLGGLAAGAIIGGLIANSGSSGSRVVSQVPPAGGYAAGSSGYIRYCSDKYRSFNPSTGTFTGYDGRTYYCR